jgi:pimeloyl-ACP methyl ester carboxylesterase
VIAFDNVGVGGSSGITPSTIDGMARDAISFIEALGIECADLLGFSIGSFVAQEIVLMRPTLVRRVVLASAAPRGAADMHGWAPQVVEAVGGPEPSAEGYLKVFFTQSSDGRNAGLQAVNRMRARTGEPDELTSWQTRQAQYDAVCSWGIPSHALLERVTAIDHRVFVTNGDSDPMIPHRYSHLLVGLLPNAQIRVYPDAAHGFLFQHHRTFASDVHSFLDED